MDKVINFFTVKGIIEPAMLFEAPFTDSSTSGLVGVFSEGDAMEIIEVIERINETAVALGGFAGMRLTELVFTTLFVPENGVARKELEWSCA